MAFQKHNFVKGQTLTAAAMNEIEDGIKNLENTDVSSVNGQTGNVNLKATDVGALPDTTKIPSSTSDLQNNSGFITKAVEDLTNYYLKGETYTREEINQFFAQIPKFSIKVVSALPTSNISETTIYLVGGGSTGNVYTEYIRVEGAWELLGTQSVNLTGYATETWVSGQLGSYLKASELDEAINAALVQAAASGEFDGKDGVGIDGVSLTKSPDEYGFYYIIITLTDGTQTFVPYRNGVDGQQGADGKDGESVTVKNVSESTADGGSNIVTFSDGSTLTVKNGSKGDIGDTGPAGSPGSAGKDGTSVTVKSVSESTADGGSNVVTFSDGKTMTIKNGSKGSAGAAGKDGSDAAVTTANITKALGYTPANAETVNQLSAAIGSSPDYVTTEADSVIERVNAAQTGRTFTFAAITDMHFDDTSGGYTDGIRHACQAMKYIDSRLKLDAVAVLGDYTDGKPAETLANSFSDFRTINGILDDLRFAPNLRLQGNHDFYADHAAEIHRHIQAYSEGVVWGDVLGGYYYRDFDAYKLRVIAVNTIETDNVRLTVSTAQYNWFVGALDLSSKDDAAQWQILVLSHHPLDWYTNDGFAFERILTAYKNGSSWNNTGSTITCNFAGKNAARLIGNIHGHIHNLLVDKIHINNIVHGNKSSIVRIATPESLVGYNNQYKNDGWGEETEYDKTKNTAKDTSFVVYCINLDAGVIKAVCYGAGYDREIDYINGTWTGQVLETYTITKSLSNCTASGDTTITENGTASLTIAASSGYELPDTVTVTGASYTWAKSTGKLTLTNPIGNVTVTVVAVQTVVTPTYNNLIPTSINADGTPYNGGQGWKANTRLNSSGVETSQDGIEVIGFIPFTLGDTAYFKNMTLIGGSGSSVANNQYVAFYDASFAKIANTRFSDAMLSSASTTYTADASNNLTSLALDYGIFNFMGLGNVSGNAKYFRICAEEINSNSIITLNEPIE